MEDWEKLVLEPRQTGSISRSYHANDAIHKWASANSGNYGCLTNVIEQRKQAAIYCLSTSNEEEISACVELMRYCNVQINQHIVLVF